MCKHTSLNLVYYTAFFAKKDGTKKASRASITGPGAYPLGTVKNLPSSHSLLLCLFLEMQTAKRDVHSSAKMKQSTVLALNVRVEFTP